MVDKELKDKFDVEDCRKCRSLTLIKAGAVNIEGEEMTPSGYWYTIECAKAPRMPVIWRGAGKPPRKCPYLEVKDA